MARGNAHSLSSAACLRQPSGLSRQGAESSRDKAHRTNTGSGHLQGEGRRVPGVCAGSDQSKLAWLLPQPTFLLSLLPPWEAGLPLCASASHKNASSVIKGCLAAETPGFWSRLTQELPSCRRDEQNGELGGTKKAEGLPMVMQKV